MLDKNNQRIPWDKAWINIAQIFAQRTTCIKFKVGCVLVGAGNRHSTIGYNGSPSGAPNCCEVGCAKDEGKRCRGCHAEINAIINCYGAPQMFAGGTVYATVLPCNDCAKALVQAGIKRVVYIEDYIRQESGNESEATLNTFKENGTKVEQWNVQDNTTTIIWDGMKTAENWDNLIQRAIELIYLDALIYNDLSQEQLNQLDQIGIKSGLARKGDSAIIICGERDHCDMQKIYEAITTEFCDRVTISYSCFASLLEEGIDLFDYLIGTLIPVIARGIRDSLFQR